MSIIPVFNQSRILYRKDRKRNKLQFPLTSGQQKATKKLLVHTSRLMEKYLFGTDSFEGFSGSEEIVVNLGNMLLKIGLEVSDFSVCVTDCGSCNRGYNGTASLSMLSPCYKT